ncbi:hypothetical protein ACF0H5_010649 [Mactra antiquata]
MNKLFMALFCMAVLSMVVSIEPKCSAFHYEEKLLEKMIRMEIEMENIQKGIQAFKEETKQQIETIADDLSSTKSQLEAPTNDVRSLNEMVAFSAQTVAEVAIPVSDQVFRFTRVDLNIGNGYDSTSGVFIAPRPGLYHFNVHICIQAGYGANFAIVVNNDMIGGSYIENKHYFTCTSASAITTLTKGSRVWVKSTYGCGHCRLYQDTQERRNSFSGFLLN